MHGAMAKSTVVGSNENGTLVFPLPNDGGTYNLILNGEGDGVQQNIDSVIANQSYSFTAK